MAYRRMSCRAAVVSNFDLPGAPDMPIHNCEDCACAVSETESAGLLAVPSPADLDDDLLWVSGREVCDLPLDQEHRVLFNPVGRGGVVVVNERAHRVFRTLVQPISARSLRDLLSAEDDAPDILARLARLQLIHPASQAITPGFDSGQLLTAWLHVSNACNLRCPYCYLNKTNHGMDEETGFAAVRSVVRSAESHGLVGVKLKYAGGEASLNHRLVLKLHELAQAETARARLQLQGVLLSNGVTLSRSLVAALKRAGIRVMISLDGIGDMHDVQRPFVSGRPSFRFVDRTIAQLIEQEHAPHLSITLTQRNAAGLADVIRFALERDLTFSINLFRENDCASGTPDLSYTDEPMILALLAGFSVIEEFMPRRSVLGAILDRGQLLEPRQRACGVGQDYVVIDQAGQVAKCHMEIERTIGDIFRDDPLDLIRHDTSSALNLAVEEKEGCRDCTWRYWCTGGCSVATFRATGRFDIKSPNCQIYKAIYPAALRLEALRLLTYAS